MKLIVTHPTGTHFSQQVGRALYEAGMLEMFLTSFIDHPGDPLSRNLRLATRLFFPHFEKEFSRRKLSGIPVNYCKTFPWFELLRIATVKLCLSSRQITSVWRIAELAFDQWAARQLTDSASAIYVYENAALETMKQAKKMGKTIFYDQPIVHFSYLEEMFAKETEEHPHLIKDCEDRLPKKIRMEFNQRKAHEHALSDYLVCFSSFTKSILLRSEVAEEKIIMIPFGFPESVHQINFKKKEAPVIFLSVGTQNLRKGTHLLFKAWEDLRFSENEAELWMVGKMELPAYLWKNLPGKVRFIPSVAKEELDAIYDLADVLVFPTLADGFGLVITEAMSRGLPVIATERCGGPDVITSGKSGWIIPAKNVEALADQMKWCVDHRNQLDGFGQMALERSRIWGWSEFRKKLAEEIYDRMNKKFKEV